MGCGPGPLRGGVGSGSARVVLPPRRSSVIGLPVFRPSGACTALTQQSAPVDASEPQRKRHGGKRHDGEGGFRAGLSQQHDAGRDGAAKPSHLVVLRVEAARSDDHEIVVEELVRRA
jgi:hypothetical protein